MHPKTISYITEEVVAISPCFRYASSVELQMKNSKEVSLQSIHLLWKIRVISIIVASHYHESTACVVSKRTGGQRQVHDACIVHTAVGKKHISQPSDFEQ